MQMAVRAGRQISANAKSLEVAGTTATPASAHAAASHLNGTLKSSGQALDPETRAYFEPRFGHDFSQVRVHADHAAASSARLADARAYTVGNDVVFGAGLYNPGSAFGRQLLGHELAHVVQQNNSQGTTGQTSDWESEANAASRRIEKGGLASVNLIAPKSMQRQPLSEAVPHVDLAESASPLLAGIIGSVNLDGFSTDKADISDGNQAKLADTANTIVTLLKQYPASTIRVIGHTDAVGQEGDNQTLSQARADSVQAALLRMGIPAVAVQTESRGASELLVRTMKSEPRNRRVEVRFETSRLLRGAMSQGLTLSPPPTAAPGKGGIPGVGDLCTKHPTLCYGKGGGAPGDPSTVPGRVFQPIPDDTPFNLMDVQGANEPYTSHGRNPNEGGDLRSTWSRLYWKYYSRGLPKSLAAKAANSELSSTAGQSQSRDNPNTADRLEKDMQQAYPNATKIGPGNFTLWKF